MSGYQLQRAGWSLHFHPKRTARFASAAARGKLLRTNEAHGKPSEDCIAVLTFRDVKRRMKVHLHIERTADLCCLVNQPAAIMDDINFLQGDNVRRGHCQDAGNPRRGQPAIEAHATMHVVRRNSYHVVCALLIHSGLPQRHPVQNALRHVPES